MSDQRARRGAIGAQFPYRTLVVIEGERRGERNSANPTNRVAKCTPMWRELAPRLWPISL